MSIELPAQNRSTRRDADWKRKNRKDGLVAISLLATTGLLSSYIAALRGSPSYAFVVPTPPTCEALTLGTGPTALSDLNLALVTLSTMSITGGCVTITIPAGVNVLTDQILVPDFTSGEGMVDVYILGSGTGAELQQTGTNKRILETNENTFISNIIFSGGNLTDTRDGGAVLAYFDLEVKGSSFISNSSMADGGAIANVAGALTISGSSFENNTARELGGAIRSSGISAVTVSSSNFSSNTAGGGGAIFAQYEYSSYLTVSGSTFSANSATSATVGRGGAVVAGKNASFSGSVFSGNTSRLAGGAIEAAENLFVSESTFTSNKTQNDGGAIDADARARIYDSIFTTNEADSDGGAVDVDDDSSVSNSVFRGNLAEDDGGAMDGDGARISVFGSTFIENRTGFVSKDSGDNGGALYIDADARVVNNTFYGNTASGFGGALSSDLGLTLAFNTFLDNLSSQRPGGSSTGDSWRLRDPDTATTSRAVGNIFASSTSLDRQVSLAQTSDVEREYNLSTGDDFEVETSNGTVTFSMLGLASTPALNRSTRETLAISSSSTAVNFVPVDGVFDLLPEVQFGAFVTSGDPAVPRDQRGVARVGNLDAGAFEFVTRAASGGVGALPVLPPAVVLPQSAQTVIPGFAANSTKLTRPMKKAIRAFVKANSELTRVTCTGFTSAPATPQDTALARQRGKVTCDFIKKINPNLEVRVLSGAHNNIPGQQIRRVRLVMK